jgi:hypothetical protein
MMLLDLMSASTASTEDVQEGVIMLYYTASRQSTLWS